MFLIQYPRARRSERARALPVGVLLLTLAALCGLILARAPQAYARVADTNPIIHWDQSMIYAGQNNGNPEGPVGETAVVHGSGFTPNQALTLVVVAGDSNTDDTVCQPPDGSSAIQVGTATADTSGNFNATFAWPAGVGHTGKVRKNSICAYSDSNLVSSHDDGPFTVLTDTKPTFSLSQSSIAAGTSLTITGQNWVPAQPLNITIASCADCDPGSNNVVSATTSSLGQTTGTFSVNVPIPSTMAPNNYVVNVTSQAGPLDAFHINGLGVKQLAITPSLVTPTPTAASTPSATAAPTQAAAATPTTGGSASNSSGSNGGNSGLVMVLLIIFAVLLLAIGGIIFFVLSQHKKREGQSSEEPQTPLPGALKAGQPNPFNAPRTPMTPFPQGQPMSTPGQLGTANPSYPGQQPWQGMPPNPRQGNPPGFNALQSPPPFQAQGPFAQGGNMARAGMRPRQCIRCGSPLAPNAAVCGVCGMRNAPASDPNDPTVAY